MRSQGCEDDEPIKAVFLFKLELIFCFSALTRHFVQPQKENTSPNTATSSFSSLLGLVVRRLTDAVQLLRAALLASFTLHTDVIVHFLGLLLRDAHAVSMVPVGTKVAANVEPLDTTRKESVNGSAAESGV